MCVCVCACCAQRCGHCAVIIHVRIHAPVSHDDTHTHSWMMVPIYIRWAGFLRRSRGYLQRSVHENVSRSNGTAALVGRRHSSQRRAQAPNPTLVVAVAPIVVHECINGKHIDGVCGSVDTTSTRPLGAGCRRLALAADWQTLRTDRIVRSE